MIAVVYNYVITSDWSALLRGIGVPGSFACAAGTGFKKIETEHFCRSPFGRTG
jgi:hypothetical protein